VSEGEAPLVGVRVLELATGVAGPYAGRLLAMLGATVVKVEPAGGDPARDKQVDDEALTGTSPLYVHLDAGKLNASAAAIEGAEWDVVIDDRVRAEIAGTGFDPGFDRGLDPARPGRLDGPLLVSVTPFGFDAEPGVPGLGAIEHEVLAQARSGIIGVQGDPGREPLRLPGWQAQYQAGATAAVAALVGLRMPGVRHLDISWTACLLTACELHVADGLGAGRRWPPTGPFPITAFPGGALPCRDGFVVPGSFRDVDWQTQCLLYDLPELIVDERYATRAARAERVDEVWGLVRGWYAERTKDEIFDLALDTPWTVGKVMAASEALVDRHLVARGFFGRLDTPDGPVVAPVRPFRTAGLPVADQRVRDTAESDGEAAITAARRHVDRRPFGGLRLLEVTTAWAGPFVGNMLGALGMDVVKFEALPPFDGYRVLRLHTDSDSEAALAMKADNRWFEASALHNAVNRNKRGVVADLRAEDGRALFLEMARNADAVLCNFTAKVLPELGLGFDDLVAVNPGIVVVRMPAFGTVGPYSAKAGYGPVVEGMGGVGARFGYEDEGARISDLYWPDPVAGAHAALAILAGIERRDRTGAGCEVDLAHMEVMWNALGEGVVVAGRRGADIGRMGNREPGVEVSGFVAAAGERWVAVVGDGRTSAAVAATRGRGCAEIVAAVRAAGGGAEVVNEVLDAVSDPRLADRFEVVEHPVTGPATQVRQPIVVDGRSTTTRRRAPLFDEHTDEVLAELAGCDAARLRELRDAKVIGGVLPVPADVGL
jgi:crotonobetainyl-CoA:carnitine CoA-transferase CaiB-like acyl-CoA transferase